MKYQFRFSLLTAVVFIVFITTSAGLLKLRDPWYLELPPKGQTYETMKLMANSPYIRFNATNTMALMNGFNGTIGVYDINLKKTILTLHGSEARINYSSFMKDDSRIISCDQESNLVIYAFPSGKIVSEKKVPSGVPLYCDFIETDQAFVLTADFKQFTYRMRGVDDNYWFLYQPIFWLWLASIFFIIRLAYRRAWRTST